MHYVERLEVYKQHDDTTMLPTMWAQKLNKLDDNKLISKTHQGKMLLYKNHV